MLEQDRKIIEGMLANSGMKNTLALYHLKGKIERSLEIYNELTKLGLDNAIPDYAKTCYANNTVYATFRRTSSVEKSPHISVIFDSVKQGKSYITPTKMLSITDIADSKSRTITDGDGRPIKTSIFSDPHISGKNAALTAKLVNQLCDNFLDWFQNS